MWTSVGNVCFNACGVKAKKTIHVLVQSTVICMYMYMYIYYVAMVTAGLYIAYTPHQYST